MRQTMLAGASLIEAHLEEADFTEAHLEGAYLSWAHLEGAFLQGAHLEGANLNGAYLERAYLMNAHLEEADLRGADLDRANLTEAHLERAKLSLIKRHPGLGLSLHFAASRKRVPTGWVSHKRVPTGWAYLNGANFWATHLEGADLSAAFGLEQYQIEFAIVDDATTLPEGLHPPEVVDRVRCADHGGPGGQRCQLMKEHERHDTPVHIARIAGTVRAWVDGAETALPGSTTYPWVSTFPRDEDP